MHTVLQVGRVISTSAINTKFLEPHKNECEAQKLNKLATLGNTIPQIRTFKLFFYASVRLSAACFTCCSKFGRQFSVVCQL